MKKILLYISIAYIFIGCLDCRLEDKKVHKIATPIIDSLHKYAIKNGIPKSFKNIINLPYNLKPCSSKPDLPECKILKDGYFFVKDGEYYVVKLWLYPFEYSPKGFGLIIVYHTTNCGYDIYSNSKIKVNYKQPACSMIGRCTGFFRQ